MSNMFVSMEMPSFLRCQYKTSSHERTKPPKDHTILACHFPTTYCANIGSQFIVHSLAQVRLQLAEFPLKMRLDDHWYNVTRDLGSPVLLPHNTTRDTQEEHPKSDFLRQTGLGGTGSQNITHTTHREAHV